MVSPRATPLRPSTCNSSSGRRPPWRLAWPTTARCSSAREPQKSWATTARDRITCWIRGSADKLAERPSPLDSIAVQIGGGTMKLCYSRPSARGRKIMGGLVPFQQPWRLGANEATSINVPFPAEIAGVRVQPGTYTLYAIPGASKWQIAVDRGVQRWGVQIDKDVRAGDVGAGAVTAEPLGTPVETLTLKFAPAAGNATELIMEWEQTRVRIPIRRTSG